MLERFSYLSYQSFKLDSPIGLGYLSGSSSSNVGFNNDKLNPKTSIIVRNFENSSFTPSCPITKASVSPLQALSLFLFCLLSRRRQKTRQT